jgi:SAM-dependent methyltransferase
MKIQEKMKRDWDRRADADPYYWVAATQEADLTSYHASAERDCQVFVEGLAPLLPEGMSGALLDLGCGIGRMTAPLALHFDRVVGVDVSPQMIARAQEFHSAQENVSFIVNSGADLGALDSETFQVACSYSVLPHLPPDVVSAYFSEVGRVLVEGGVFRYQFWVGPSHHPEDHDTLGIHVYTEEEIGQLHHQAGLTEVSREEIDYFDPVLKLKPVWVNARRELDPIELNTVEREVTDELSDHELTLEYELMLHLAFRYYEQGRGPEAETILERAKQLDPSRPEAYLHWADLRLGQDDLRGALMLLEELTDRCPETPQGWLLRAQVALGEERYQEAVELLKPLVKLDLAPESEEYKLYRELKRLATHGHLNQLKEKHKRQHRSKSSKKRGR